MFKKIFYLSFCACSLALLGCDDEIHYTPNPPSNPPSTCGNIDENGICDGNVAKVCKNGALSVKTCADTQNCKPREDGQVDCIDKNPSPSNCGNIDSIGICENNILKYCQDDALITEYCPAGCDTSNGNAVCKSAKCEQITSDGICQNNNLVFCNTDGLLYGQVCQKGCLVQNSGRAECKENIQPCGDITEAGKCSDDNSAVIFCNPTDQALAIQTCAQGCIVGQDKIAVCKEESKPSTCDDIPNEGVCENDILTYCDNSQTLHQERCFSGCKKNNQNYLECAPTPCGDVTNNGECSDDKSLLIYCENNTLRSDVCQEGKCASTDGWAQCHQKCDEGLDKAGKCFDDLSGVRFCDNTLGQVQYSCKDGEECGIQNGEAQCIAKTPAPECSDSNPCKDAAMTCKNGQCVAKCKPSCNENTLTSCDKNGAPITKKCADGTICGKDESGTPACVKNSTSQCVSTCHANNTYTTCNDKGESTLENCRSTTLRMCVELNGKAECKLKKDVDCYDRDKDGISKVCPKGSTCINFECKKADTTPVEPQPPAEKS